MHVLVTGGAGFVGSHVVAEMIEAGHEVSVFDIATPKRGRHVQGDLTLLDDLVAATCEVDAICHLAAVGDVYLAFENPPLAASMNVVGTANVMEAALRNKVGKVVYASTWEVYGRPVYQPIDEEHPCDPDHPYNITKLAGERLALAYERLKGVPAVALRLGTAYGRGMRPNSVFSIFIDRASRGEPIVIQGGGEQARQFTHASDIGRAFRLAAESPVSGRAFNIVADENVSIRQLAELVTEVFPTTVQRGTARPGDIESAIVSNANAKTELGWRPGVEFREGLRDLMRQTADSAP